MTELWTIIVMALCAALAITLAIFIPSMILWGVYKLLKIAFDYFITGNVSDNS